MHGVPCSASSVQRPQSASVVSICRAKDWSKCKLKFMSLVNLYYQQWSPPHWLSGMGTTAATLQGNSEVTGRMIGDTPPHQGDKFFPTEFEIISEVLALTLVKLAIPLTPQLLLRNGHTYYCSTSESGDGCMPPPHDTNWVLGQGGTRDKVGSFARL